MKIITRRTFLNKTAQIGFYSLFSSLLNFPNKAIAYGSKININVGYMSIIDHLILPVSHALYNSTYKNISITPHLCRSWDEILGKLDMGILNAAFLLTPLAMKTFYFNNMKCILLGHRNGSVIASSPEIKSAEDLSKAVIGIPHSHSTHTILLYKYFKDNGIDNLQDISLKKIPPLETVSQLQDCKINAYSVAEPWGMLGVNKGVVHIIEHSKNIIPNHPCCILMIRERFLKQHKNSVKKWVASLQSAGEFIHKNYKKAAELQKNYMYLNVGDVFNVLKKEHISYRNLGPNQLEFKKIFDLAFEAGLLQGQFEMKSFVNTSFAG